MLVTPCAPPTSSAISAGRRHADFACASRTRLTQPDRSVTEAFHAIFAHRPPWMNAALLTRNRFAAACGLETSTDEELLHPVVRALYTVGEKIGGWPIHALTPHELVAGRDNAHMDFRVSLLKVRDDLGDGLIVTTFCWTKNAFGRLYLAAVVPFHRPGLDGLIANTARAGRL